MELSVPRKLEELKEVPHLIAFLPMLYVAWADEILLPSEIEKMERVIEAQSWLTDADKRILYKWLDPNDPPSAREIQHWVKLIRKSGKDLKSETRGSLADLGMEIAKINTEDGGEVISHEKTRAALCEMEEALGIVGHEACRELVSDKRPEIKEEGKKLDFDPARITRVLDGDKAEIKHRMRVILADPKFKYQEFESKKEFREQVFHWCQLLAEQGFGAAHFPKEYGGGGDMSDYVAIFEMMGYHDLSLLIKFGVQFGLWGGSVMWLGTKQHHEKYLKAIGDLSIPGSFAMTESGHGSNVREIETTATYDPTTKEFIIHTPSENARKEYIGNAAVHGRMASVFAQLETNGESYGVHAFVVPLRDEAGNTLPGIRIADNGTKLGLNGVDNGRIWFDQVRVPRENLLNRFGDVSEAGEYSSPISSESRRFFTMLGTLVGGRVCVPMGGLSATKSGLTIAIKYALKRRQFGPADKPETLLLDYPTHQRRLMPLLAKTYALDFAHKYVVKEFLAQEEGADTREIEALAAGLKAYSTWHATAALQECREACGGNGYLSENRFADLKADTDVFTTFEGDNTVLMQLVAKGRLTAFKQEFRKLDLLGYVRFFGHQASHMLAENNPLYNRKVDEKHLLDTQFHLDAFTYREEELVLSAAQRLKKKIDRGDDAYEAFLAVQQHLVVMAEAYVERIVLQEFIKAVKLQKGGSIYRPLLQLCQLYALHTLEKHKGWYLEKGFFEGSKTRAIRKQVDRLCKLVREDAGGLVDAFAIPEQCLGAAVLSD